MIVTMFTMLDMSACNINFRELESTASTFRKQIVQRDLVPTEEAITRQLQYVLIDNNGTNDFNSSSITKSFYYF